MIAGMETVLCLGFFLAGALGLFVMFWLTDRNAVQESYYAEHNEQPKPVTTTAGAPAAKAKEKKG